MSPGARRPPRPDYLALACRALNELLCLQRRMAKEDPHIFGLHSSQYLLDTFEMEREEQEWEAALCRTYGPPAPGQPEHISTLWTDRYYPEPNQRRLFLKWFHEKYP